MSKGVRVVLLCEDKQHEVFLRRFIRKDGWTVRDLTVKLSPAGRGSAEQYIRSRFPGELKKLRSKRGERVYLIVMIDGDAGGVAKRKASIEEACLEQGIKPPDATDNVLICVPTWNIETWLAYLDGETADETRKDYKRLPRQRECIPMVNTLVDMCRHETLRPPAPQSLQDACHSYRSVFRLQP